MKKLTALIFCCCISFIAFAQNTPTGTSIIPAPVSLIKKNGLFVLPKKIIVQTNARAQAAPIVSYLQSRISYSTGASFVIKDSGPGTLKLRLNKATDTLIGKEGYRLVVTPKSVTISANDAAGLFYGVQTFLQLLPKEVESHQLITSVRWTAPCVNIADYPRFQWRGLMFDVSRHFFTKADVERYIDDMVRYKYNVLHMHLTDNEGWRIEIKSLPRLTQIGAWNVKKVGYFGKFSPPAPDEPRNYGGFYTQDDIRELVRYAQERFVNILPEIDVPGHSLAAVVAYPSLSCTPEASNYVVRSGEPITKWDGPRYTTMVDNTLCPANENVYEFLDKVITEVAQLFPFPYIHMGGDECAKNFWEKSDAIKVLMQREGLKSMSEVQSYFEQRVEKIVESKGKRLMGWDEILEGGLAPNAMVMSWRGMQGGIRAAKMHHDVVMSPTTFAYLDYMQGDPVVEPHIYAALRLSKAYQFEPVPDSIEATYVKGGQANLWTEQVYNIRHAEYMTWPRGLAISETLWSPKRKKNWHDFMDRVEKQFGRFDEASINYSPSVYDPIFTSSLAPDNTLKVELNSEMQGLDIYYTFDNSFPDRFYPKYTEPLSVPKDAVMLKVITYKGNKPVGRMIYMPVDELKSRADKKAGNN